MSYVKSQSTRIVKYCTTTPVTLTADEGVDTVHFSGSITPTLNLPALAGLHHGDTILVSNLATGACTVTANGSDLIQGSGTLTVAIGKSALIVANGLTGTWQVLYNIAS